MPTASQLKRAAHKEKFRTGAAELEELQARAWRYRRGDDLSEFAPTPVHDEELSSRLFGPQLKTVQWRRE